MRLLPVTLAIAVVTARAQTPTPPGRLVDIGGQRLHLACAGSGAPSVIFEAGAGDFSVIWSLVQARVVPFTRACSYDRGGYAWSDPGRRPRTFAQLTLELHTLLERANVPGPYVLVGQSFGASLVRDYAQRYPADVAGMVLVDAIHEDGWVVWGGQAHHLRDQATGRTAPEPRIALDTETLGRLGSIAPASEEALEPPLDLMPPDAQRVWRWAAARPVSREVQPLEMEWSAEVAEHTFRSRQRNRALLGDIPLIVLARTNGDYAPGMNITADSPEHLRRAQQSDLALLSTNGSLRYAPHSGHNIHLEDPVFVAGAIRDVVARARRRAHARQG